MSDFTVAALYHFTRFADPAALRGPLLATCQRAGIKGSLLIAAEGINGTIAGSRAGIDQALAAIRALPGCASLAHKESYAAVMPFLRLKVRLKKEIVTMGQGAVISYDVDGRELWRLTGVGHSSPSPLSVGGLLYLGGMCVMGYNVYKTVRAGKAVDDPVPAALAHA